MKLMFVSKIWTIFIILILILINIYGINFGTSKGSLRLNDNPPDSALKQYIWGGIGEDTDAKYGWNLTYIDDLNGDVYPDLVIGSPWYDGSSTDMGAVYIFYGLYFVKPDTNSDII